VAPATVRVVPEHRELPVQSSSASAIDQLDAPGTVGPPEFAEEPGADGAGGVAGCCGPCSPTGACSLAA
jgi:hypothetical protein